MKIDFAVVFMNITRRGALSEEFIHTVEMIVIKITFQEIHKTENKRLVIYTDSHSSMKSIEYNKENDSILNLIYDILVELKNKSHYLKFLHIYGCIKVKKQIKQQNKKHVCQE